MASSTQMATSGSGRERLRASSSIKNRYETLWLTRFILRLLTVFCQFCSRLQRKGLRSSCKMCLRGLHLTTFVGWPLEKIQHASPKKKCLDLSTARFLGPFENLWRIKKFLNIGSEKHLKKALSIVHGYSIKIIRSRMLKGMELDGREDLLSRFASIKDSNEDMLRDIVTNFLLAGRETTSTALTWFFWLVSTSPDVEKKILDEIKCVRSSKVITTETFSFDDLRDMNYLHAAITESMRLYPPVPLDTVSCKEDDVMPDGTFVGKGWFVTYSAYVMGRSEDIWGKDCMEFKPERWLDENGVFKPESPFRYPVFHAGPRMCLGKEMAYIQMKSIAACMLERFQIRSLKEGTPEHILSLALRMKGGLPVLLSKRED
ncbi:hypothetical protein LUZ63_013249 [Rhynchospora breviuscula]|uniref:Cytochrome P450 n=1 Tax=Rhynchospora breviuscula TaxID=2022672 RepID=A0A9Q0C874_9POAL|nr:hypothetical protein LUZ63_013249 [Rhynchospora breviuscula]